MKQPHAVYLRIIFAFYSLAVSCVKSPAKDLGHNYHTVFLNCDGSLNQQSLDSLGCALFQASLQRLWAARCQNHHLFFSCSFAIYLRLSMQLSFPLHKEMCANKGNCVLVYRCGALAAGVVSVVMGFTFALSLKYRSFCWSVTSWFQLYTATLYQSSDRFTPAQSSSLVQSILCQSSSSQISEDVCRHIVFLVKKEEVWHENKNL